MASAGCSESRRRKFEGLRLRQGLHFLAQALEMSKRADPDSSVWLVIAGCKLLWNDWQCTALKSGL